MTDPASPPSARRFPGLLALCGLLGLFALLGLGAAVYLFMRGATTDAVLTLAAAILLAATALGLYRLKRWGVVLFGLLVVLGSINHLANVLAQYSHLPTGDLLGAGAALLGILIAIAIPVVLIYLTLLLWRQTKS